MSSGFVSYAYSRTKDLNGEKLVRCIGLTLPYHAKNSVKPSSESICISLFKKKKKKEYEDAVKAETRYFVNSRQWPKPCCAC